MKRINWKNRIYKARKLLTGLNKPLHYKEIFKSVCNDLPMTNGHTRCIENFRNCLDYESLHFSHIGKGMFGLRCWYKSIIPLISPDLTTIDRDDMCRRNAYHEAIEREPYMINKYNEDYRDRVIKIGEGLTAEHHVREEYERKYNGNFIKPDNDFKTPLSWDFGIKTPLKTYYFDVKSSPPNVDNLVVEVSRLKNNVDFFISVTRGQDYYRINGIATKDILKRYGIPSSDGKKITLRNQWLIHEGIIDVYINHSLIGIDCGLIVKRWCIKHKHGFA